MSVFSSEAMMKSGMQKFHEATNKLRFYDVCPILPCTETKL